MELTPNTLIQPDTKVCTRQGNRIAEFLTDAVTGKLLYLSWQHGIQVLDDPNITYADLLENAQYYTIKRNNYGTQQLGTEDNYVLNNDYVATKDGLFIIDIPKKQSVVTLEPEKLILPLTNVVTGERITIPIGNIVTRRDDTFYHNLYALYTGEPTETRGYLKAAHHYDKEFKMLIDRAILKHALTSEETFKQALGDLCDQHGGYINTRGIYDLDGSDKQFYTSLDGDNVITEEAKYDTSDCALHLTKRTATPLRLYMAKIKNTQTRGGLYDAIQHLHSGNIFSITSNFRSRPTTLES